MTNTEIAELVTQEACERASRAFVNYCDECSDTNALTAEQKIVLGSSLLREFMGMQDTVERMLHTADVMSRFPLETIADEAAEFLRDYEGPKQ